MGTVTIDIDTDEVMDQVSDKELAAEVARRKMPSVKREIDWQRTAAIDAINKIRRGDYADAITTLEREFLPKWNDRADCAAAYREAMAEPKEWR